MENDILTPDFVASLIAPREKDSNKGNYGHVLVLAGSRGMAGAAVLCANAALRAGAGLVTVGMPESIQPLMAGRLRPEAMTLPLPDGKYGSLDPAAFPLIMETIRDRRVSALVIGPGLGNNDDTYALVRKLVRFVALPVVIDADALNVFSRETTKDAIIESFADAKADIIITPHPGELSRLNGCSIDAIQADRPGAARAMAHEHCVVCVLKGYRTVVSDGRAVCVNPTGNPGMATGGSGDVLAGMIAALIAQVTEPKLFRAALAGVYLHGLAGDIAVRTTTEIALLAGDIIDFLPDALQKIQIQS